MKKILSRRNSVVGGLSVLGLSSSCALDKESVPALPGTVENWTTNDKVYALAKQQGRLDEGKVIWRIKGVIYGFKDPNSPLPLVRFKGCEQQWFRKISDVLYLKFTSLLTYYSDFETDNIIDRFTNPITKQDVRFKPNWSRVPEGSAISPRGSTLNIIEKAFPDFYSESSIDDVEMDLIGGIVSFHAKMRWPEPLVRSPYNQDNTFFATLEDLQDSSKLWIPSHGAGQIMMPSMSNIGMGDPLLGQVLWHVEYYKIKSWDDLPADYLEKAMNEHGDEFDLSPENDTEPSKLASNLKRLGYLTD